VAVVVSRCGSARACVFVCVRVCVYVCGHMCVCVLLCECVCVCVCVMIQCGNHCLKVCLCVWCVCVRVMLFAKSTDFLCGIMETSSAVCYVFTQEPYGSAVGYVFT